MEDEEFYETQQQSQTTKRSSSPLLLPNLKHHVSDMKDNVSYSECEKVGQLLAGDWEKVARLLQPPSLDEEQIIGLKKFEQNPEEQAKMMLHKWRREHGSKANQYCLLKALIEAGKTTVAESVFGDLVKTAEKVSIIPGRH
jgi:hypothetical protein